MSQWIGQYEIVRTIAVGGMGELFLARLSGADGFSKSVVIKRLLPHLLLEQGFIDMFRDEASIMAQMHHENIAQVLDFGEDDGQFFLVLEYVDGVTLAQVIDGLGRTGKVLGVPEVAYVISQVAEALDYAHRKIGADGRPLNIVHRDVSPSNVLLSREGAVKLTDFGIARARHRLTRTDSGLVKGKFAYMAPEVLGGDSPSPLSDLFTLGGVLFEALTGQQAFRGATDAETINRVEAAKLDPPSQINPAVPADIDQLVVDLTRRDPRRRMARARDVVRRLAPFTLATVSPRDLIAGTLRTLGSTLRSDALHELTTAGATPAGSDIVIVDPSADSQSALQAVLGDMFTVGVAANAEDASSMLLRAPPKLVICQRDLPGTSGLDLCRFIRAEDRLTRIPFVLVAPEVGEALALHARAVGAQAVVSAADGYTQLRDDVLQLMPS